MAETLGVGVIGVGRTVRAVAASCASLEEFRLVAVADVDEAKGRAFAEQQSVDAYTDYHDMIARDDVDVVYVLLPHFLHHPAGLACLNAGKHVFMEKPLAMDVAECNDLIDAAKANGVQLMTGHHYHFDGPTLAARNVLQSGDVGRPIMAVSLWHKAFFGQERTPWFLDGSKGGGAWPMNGSHMIDRLMWETGQHVLAVTAQVGSPIFGMSATDSAIATLRFDGDFTATICHSLYKQGAERFEAEYVCEEAMLRVTDKVVEVGREERYTPVEVPPMRAQAEQNAAFAKALVSGQPMPTSGEYGREVVAVMQAAEQSAARRAEVQVAELLPSPA